MFTDEFIKAYPTPWLLQGMEVVDAEGAHVQGLADDTNEDRDFWQGVVNAVNATAARQIMDDEDLLRVGERIAEMAMQVKNANLTRPGPEAVWHFEIDDDRYQVRVALAAPAKVPEPVRAFLADVAAEIERAALLHPGPNPNLAALTEEVGEVAKAVLEARQSVLRMGRIMPEDWENVQTEAVQVAAMAFRVVFEGDPTMDVVPE